MLSVPSPNSKKKCQLCIAQGHDYGQAQTQKHKYQSTSKLQFLAQVQAPPPVSSLLGNQTTVFLLRRFSRRDGPNEHPEHCLGDNVCDRVSDLLISSGNSTCKAYVFDDVHEGIGEPRDSGQVSCTNHETLHRLWLLRSCRVQPCDKGENHISKRNHGQFPPHPTSGQIILDLAWVTQRYHDCRR